MVVSEAKKRYPWLEIYLWSGYTYEQLLTRSKTEPKINLILKNVKVLIDGPYDEPQRDITLPLRGSHN
jgi:anaerobic ribonucleoside-triphosphate reductase activating protein